jgi:hypothetical protein
MLSKFTKTLLVLPGLLPLLLSSFCLADSGKAYFNISLDRSVNIILTDGSSKIRNTGDAVTIGEKGRLWLTGNETKQGFVEIICQNLSTEPVSVEFVDEAFPWIDISRATRCGDWKKNILICPAGKMERGIFCKITERVVIDTSGSSKRQASASVNVRSLDMESQNKEMDESKYLQERIDYYGAGIDLCGEMHKKTEKILISWVIYAGGAVDKVKMADQTAAEDNDVAQCIAEQISLWKFPHWEKDSQISYRF